ncbi:MAG: hypothetical protein STSR0004_13000 [Peptococcaceae bacterium]
MMKKKQGFFKKKKIWLLFFILFGLVVFYWVGLVLAQGTDEPGTSADPLVTKSYVTEFVGRYFQENIGTAVKKILSETGTGGAQWQIKTISAGQDFTGGAGTEFILRTGTALALDPTGSGIPDLTGGINLAAGKVVPPNHLILIPRADGRGIRAQTAVVIMHR